ncbi:MAG TPA: cytochrome P450 [Ktedonobacterales bacterium]|nr:cytochrome P450 [Ktedonobacterales bacterium]
MGKRLSEAPITDLGPADFMSGLMPSRIATEAQRLGPLFRWPTRFGPDSGREIVFLVGPEANRLVFHTRREAFSHDLGWTPIIGDLMGAGLLNQDGAVWARSRKMWNPAFTNAYMETYLPLMQRVIATHTEGWAARARVDLFQEAREITFHVAATALAGIDAADEVAHLQRLFYALLPRAVTFADQQEYDAYERAARAARDELDALLLRLIAERRAAPEEQTRDVLGRIVHARDDEGRALTDEEVLGHLYILLVAGHETTTTLGAWTLYLLATQPAPRARVEGELETLLAGARNPLSVEEARNLHALDMFIREAGRLHSPVQTVPRGVVEEVEFAGYTLPVGTMVRLAVNGGHRLPSVFTDPDAFDPDRFAAPREEDKKAPYSLVTFGGGPRLCIGINFANIEVKALAVDVLRRYTLEPMEVEPPFEVGFVTLAMPQGMPMRVQPSRRNGAA